MLDFNSGIQIMKRVFVFVGIIFFACTLVNAQENVSENLEESVQVADESQEKNEEEKKDFRNFIIPSLDFNVLQIGEKDFCFSPVASLQFMRIKNSEVISSQPDSILLSASYAPTIFNNGIGDDEVKMLHSLSFVGSVGFNKNLLMALVSSNGEIPFSDIRSVIGGLLYSRDLIKTDKLSFSLGAGIVFGDFDLNIKGFDIYVIPLPLFSLNYYSNICDLSLSLMGPPSFRFTFFPKKMFRFKGSLGIMNFDSIRDLTFDFAFVCYPLNKTSAGDFLSIALGIMNDETSFVLKDKKEYGWQHYSVYAELDASLVSFKAGYNFNGKNLIDEEAVSDLYKGIFATIHAMYFF